MFYRWRISLILGMLLSLLFVFPVFAGGWAVITLDELPSNVVAGEPLTIGFTVLQHGRTPMADLSPIIVANLDKDAEVKIIAEEEGAPGHYTATLTFPKEGDWQWSIQAFTMDQKMPVLNVAAPQVTTAAEPPVPVATVTEPAALTASPMVVISVALLALGLAGVFLSLRRRNRWVIGLTAFCLLAGIILLAAGAGTASEVEAQAKSEAVIQPAAKESSVSQIELGRQLFIAKGCITCHVNTKAASQSEYWTIEMGAPNLSNFSAAPEVLYIRLKDPASAKSDTEMPDLGLKREEIEALIAFINSK